MFGEVITMKGWRVLLADDNDINLRLLARKLTSGPFEKLEWQVETATTGEEALKKIDEAIVGEREGEEGRYDLVVLDENMQPNGLLGTDVTRILRGKDERVLIVGSTGNSSNEDSKLSKESGQDMFWSKPAPPSKDALNELTSALVTRRRNGYRKRRSAKRKIGQEREMIEGTIDAGRAAGTKHDWAKEEKEEKEKEEQKRLPGQVG